MSTASYEALGKLAGIRLFLEAFRASTGIPLHFKANHVPQPPAPPHPSQRLLMVPLVVGGDHVANFVSDPVVVAAVGDRGPSSLPDAPRPITSETIQGMEQLVTLYARQLSLLALSDLAANHPDDPPKVRSAKKYIHDNAGQPISAEQIARHVHMSTDHLRRVFGKATGMTLTEFIQRVRVEKAQELLADCSRRIIDVAFASGFESASQFNRVFKQCTGQTPRAFRASPPQPRERVKVGFRQEKAGPCVEIVSNPGIECRPHWA